MNAVGEALGVSLCVHVDLEDGTPLMVEAVHEGSYAFSNYYAYDARDGRRVDIFALGPEALQQIDAELRAGLN